MRHIWTRFPRDFTSRGKRAAVLGGCLLLGCCLWIPVLTRAASTRSEEATVRAEGTIPVRSQVSQANSAASHSVDADDSAYWSNLTNALKHDPLFQPADLTQLTRDPFSAGESQQRTVDPMLANVAKLHSEFAAEANAVADQIPAGLELRSTMIGRMRRVANINGEVCELGEHLSANGHRYQLTIIESHRVVLTADNKNYELKLVHSEKTDPTVTQAP